jgi:hypothetical protein
LGGWCIECASVVNFGVSNLISNDKEDNFLTVRSLNI